MTNQMKVLIGYDGSIYCEAAIEDLRRAGLPDTGEALVVSVADDSSIAQVPALELIGNAMFNRNSSLSSASQDERRHAAAMSLAGAELARRNLPNWKVTSKSTAGNPANELILESRNFNADLIVVGSQGRSTVGRFILGSVSKTVASDADCSVRIGRVKTSSTNEAVILLGIDGSVGAARAVRNVAHRNWPARMSVRVVVVDDGSGKDIIDIPPTVEALVTACSHSTHVEPRLMAEAARVLLEDLGLIVEIEVIQEDALGGLLGQMRSVQPSFAIIGARGRDSEDFPNGIGEVASSLVTDAPCSIEVAR